MFSSQKVRRTSFDAQITLLLDGERELRNNVVFRCWKSVYDTSTFSWSSLHVCVFDRKMWGSGSVIAAALMFHSCIRWPFSIVYKHVVSLQIVHSRPNIRYYLLICILHIFVKGKKRFLEISTLLKYKKVPPWLDLSNAPWLNVIRKTENFLYTCLEDPPRDFEEICWKNLGFIFFLLIQSVQTIIIICDRSVFKGWR